MIISFNQKQRQAEDLTNQQPQDKFPIFALDRSSQKPLALEEPIGNDEAEVGANDLEDTRSIKVHLRIKPSIELVAATLRRNVVYPVLMLLVQIFVDELEDDDLNEIDREASCCHLDHRREE